jgi:hypothetical protein
MEEKSYTSTHPLGQTGPVTGSLYFYLFTGLWVHAYNIHAGATVTVCPHAHVCVFVCHSAQKRTYITTTETICIHFRNVTGNLKETHNTFKMNAIHQLLD